MMRLACTVCSAILDIEFPGWRCPACGGPLEISRPRTLRKISDMVAEGRGGMWRYGPWLPFSSRPITLGEGGTPLIKSEDAGVEVLLKLEFISPTGSFKDRGASMSISRAVALGANRVVEDSTGNAGVAASVYAAHAGIRSRIYVPADAPNAKKALMRACGAEIIECKDRAEAAARAVSELVRGDFYIGHTWDPFYIAGMETVAFEVYEQYGLPDSILVPVASGTLLLGLYQGFCALFESGISDRIPRIFGVQGEDCAPIYEELHGPVSKSYGSVLADGLRIAHPPRKTEIIDAIRLSGGDVFIVSDPEIADGLKCLLGMGIMAEPTSATAFASLPKAYFGNSVLVPITGSGFKHPDAIVKALEIE